MLLSKFAAPGRTLVCFEPGKKFTFHTAALLNHTVARHSFVIPSFFDATVHEIADGIDLFLSSHVLEHVGDLCSFLRELFAKMKPGGFVFSEVPNHNYKYVNRTFGGLYHLSLTTPGSLNAYFYSAGFRLVDMQLTDQSDTLRGDGFHIRSLYMRPTTLKKQTGVLG